MLMRSLLSYLVLVIATSTPPAFALNKCVSPAGKVSFQDTPCSALERASEVTPRPAAGPHSPPAPAGVQQPTATSAAQAASEKQAASASPGTPYQRQLATLEAERLKREVSDAVRFKKEEISKHRANCDAEQQAIRSQKARANNNLAGATWEQALSSEMNAAAKRCDTRGRELQGDLEDLRQLCSVRGCA